MWRAPPAGFRLQGASATAVGPCRGNGSSREFYPTGLSANATGISVFVLGLDDKTYRTRTYGASIGKANLAGD